MPDGPVGGHGECPDVETLAAYADGTLDVRARGLVEAHLATCEDCYELVTEVATSQEMTDAHLIESTAVPPVTRVEREPTPVRSAVVHPTFGRKRMWTVAGSVLAVAAALLLMVRVQPEWWQRVVGGGGVDPRLEKLVTAVGEARTIEARLTGGFKYGPLRSAVRSGNSSSYNLSLMAAAGELQRAATDTPTDENLHALGLAQLLVGQPVAAVASLEQALAGNPSNARYLSDLAAARLAVGEASGETRRLAEAVDAAQRALRIDPGLFEAQFNLALALERLGAVDPARRAWEQYLTLDGSSQWAAEARRHLERLAGKVGGCDPERLPKGSIAADVAHSVAAVCGQMVREYLEGPLLANWAEKHLTGDAAGAERLLADGETLATALDDLRHDAFDLDAIRALKMAPGNLIDTLAMAHRSFARGQQLYDNDHRSDAVAPLLTASTLLRSNSSPFWLWAEHYLARIASHRRDLTDASTRLDAIRRHAEGYLALSARESWLRGVVALQDSRPVDALVEYRRAARAYDALGEPENAASVLNTMADTERILGEIDSGWRTLGRALALVDQIADPTRRYLAFYNANLYSQRSGLWQAALVFQDEAVAQAGQRRGRVAVIEALTNRALTHARVGDALHANDDLAVAEGSLGDVTDAHQRAYMQARINAVRAEITEQNDPATAARSAEAALAFFAKAEPAEVPRIHLLKARIDLRSEASEDADGELTSGIRAFEQRLDGLRSQPFAISYFDEGWGLYQLQIEQYLRAGRSAEAFDLFERTRARSLHRPTVDFRATSAHTMLGKIPAGVAVVAYASVTTGIHWWVLTSAGMRDGHLAVPLRQLEQNVV